MIPVRDALQVLVDWRDASSVVITHQGSARIWPQLAEHPLDFHYNPSTMGGAVPFGLGIALTHRNRQVLVVTGDGSLAMNLGSLISVVAANATNISIVVLDNGIYEVTGGQKVATREAAVDFAGLGTSSGFPTTAAFDELQDWRAFAPRMLKLPGPRLISLSVDRAHLEEMQVDLPPIRQRISDFEQTLSG